MCLHSHVHNEASKGYTRLGSVHMGKHLCTCQFVYIPKMNMWICLRMNGSLYVGIYVCMYIWYVCMCVYVCISIYIYIDSHHTVGNFMEKRPDSLKKFSWFLFWGTNV